MAIINKKKKRKKLAILVALSDLNPCYSIAGVVSDQLEMLKDKDYDLVFITCDEFKDKDLVPPEFEIRLYPRFWSFKSPKDSEDFDIVEFDNYKLTTGSILKTLLQDVDYVITHDLMFLDCFLWVNWAIREAAQTLPNVKWLNWVHSGPSLPPDNLTYPLTGCYEILPNSVYCYPNRSDIVKVAEMFGCKESLVRTVYNCINPYTYFKLHPLSKEMYDKYKLWDQDYICVYPTRMTEAKQPDKIIKLFARLKNKKFKLIICNSWSNGEKEIKYLGYLKELCKFWSIEDNVIFTSELESNWAKESHTDLRLGVPKEVVTDLMKLADLFIMPSIAETASLVMLEAAMAKNLVVVNEDILCMREFADQKQDSHSSKRSLQFQFGSITRPIHSYNPSEDQWYDDHARIILNYSDSDKAVSYFRYARKYHSLNWVWENQLEPLLA